VPAPKNPNPEPGAAARRQLGDATAAARLRKHGWLVFSPKVLALLPAESVARLKRLSEEPGGG
jgi:hypothetical protein